MISIYLQDVVVVVVVEVVAVLEVLVVDVVVVIVVVVPVLCARQLRIQNIQMIYFNGAFSKRRGESLSQH